MMKSEGLRTLNGGEGGTNEIPYESTVGLSCNFGVWNTDAI